jgi:hypothetical protein
MLLHPAGFSCSRGVAWPWLGGLQPEAPIIGGETLLIRLSPQPSPPP